MKGDTPYDLVPYPSGVFAQTWPDRLGAVATLHGLGCAPPQTARVLEIGCGDGLNLIALAVAYPEGRFEGFDLAATAIEKGQALAGSLGLANVSLSVQDLKDAAPPAEAFDYVIAQGVHSWVDAPEREALMALIRRTLAPDGVAYVSFNALPGGHVRRMVREMLLRALTGVKGARQRMERALTYLRSLAEAPEDDDPGRAYMQAHCRRLLARPPEAFFHDELSEVFEPVYLEEFAAHAGGHGLQFLNEASFELLLDGLDTLAAAQAADFAEVRSYRQSLLVRSEARPLRSLDQRMLGALFVSHRMREDRLKDLAGFLDDDAALAAAHDRVLKAWPDRLPIHRLPGAPGIIPGIFELVVEGFLALHAGPAPYATDAGERPCVSPLVRAQLAAGHAAVATLSGVNLNLPDEPLRRFLGLMDGSRDDVALADAADDLFDDGLTLDRRLDKLAGLALFPR